MTEPFTFAVISDTHIRALSGDQSSPYAVNEKANGRARYAVQLIAAQNPDLIIHLGDMVHPLPHMAAYLPAREEAKRFFHPIAAGLHVVPGTRYRRQAVAFPPSGRPTDQSGRREALASSIMLKHQDVNFVVMTVAGEYRQRSGTGAKAVVRQTLRAAKGGKSPFCIIRLTRSG